jgi:hypothetical protein
MSKFKYEVSVPAPTEKEAERKIKAATSIMSKLTTEEMEKIAEVVSNPIQLAIMKSKLS